MPGKLPNRTEDQKIEQFREGVKASKAAAYLSPQHAEWAESLEAVECIVGAWLKLQKAFPKVIYLAIEVDNCINRINDLKGYATSADEEKTDAKD